MTYSREQVAGFFDRYADAEYARFDKDGLGAVHLHLHQHYLAAWIPRGARVLDIGAGPGRFTEALHQRGCRVVVADISPVQLELNRRNARERGFAPAVESWQELDIADLGSQPKASFDAVLAYGGPLSYVFERREEAVAGCRRVLKPGGILLASVMSLWGTLHRHLPVLRELSLVHTRDIVATGDLTAENDPTSQHKCHMYRAADFRALLERHGFRIEALSASNALATNMEPLLQELRAQPDRWEALLALEIEAGAQPGFVDGGTHIIAAARAP